MIDFGNQSAGFVTVFCRFLDVRFQKLSVADGGEFHTGPTASVLALEDEK